MGNLPTGNEYEITMTGYGARIFKRCVDHELERWPGGDPDEQIYLMKLQTVINAIVLAGYDFKETDVNKMELLHKPEFWLILLTAVSEIIGMSKMKENSVAQLVLSLLENGLRKGQGKR